MKFFPYKKTLTFNHKADKKFVHECMKDKRNDELKVDTRVLVENPRNRRVHKKYGNDILIKFLNETEKVTQNILRTYSSADDKAQQVGQIQDAVAAYKMYLKEDGLLEVSGATDTPHAQTIFAAIITPR